MKRQAHTLHIAITTLLLLFICAASNASAWPALPPKTVAQYENEIRAYFKQYEWDRGKQLLDKGIKEYPSSTQMNELMGEYYLHLKMYDNARYFLIRALQLFEGNDKARYMLVTVEEVTGNYSSAICYVNELLESEPYSRELWYKKASLYRLQGNDVEADRQLKRLMDIFPNDTLVRQKYRNRVEENYMKAGKQQNDESAVKSLRSLIDAVPGNPQYYIDLCNIYIRQGNKAAALSVAEEGIFRLRGNAILAKKKISILQDLHRYSEALSFVRDYERAYGAGLGNIKKYLEEEAARNAANNEPYMQQARLYESTKNPDALKYLTNISYTREYNEDALFYIKESLKRHPDDVRLLYMEYVVYRRMGYHSKAMTILKQAHEIAPDNDDVMSEISYNYMHEAVNLMNVGQYEEALPLLNFIIDNDTSTENLSSAINRKFTCLNKLERYTDALALLEKAGPGWVGDTTYVIRKAEMLAASGLNDKALATLEENQDLFDIHSAYEELATPYIKTLIEIGAVKKAYGVTKQLLAVNPNSKVGLMFQMTTCGMLHRDEEFLRTVRLAHRLYPNDVDIELKKIAVYNENGDYVSASYLLKNLMDTLPMNPAVVNAFSTTADLRAQAYMNTSHARQALAVLDSALFFDPLNKTLLYDKGLAYEKLRIYDSASLFQRHYTPSDMERDEATRRNNDLLYRSFDRNLQMYYQRSSFGNKSNLMGVAGMTYSQKDGNNVYGGGVNYAGRDGKEESTLYYSYFASGGTGVQLLGSWEHTWKKNFVSTLSGGWASRYFPQWQLNLTGTREAKNDYTVEMHVGYRRIITTYEDYEGWTTEKTNLWNVGAGVSKDLYPFLLNGRLDLLLHQKLCFNASLQGRYYPLEVKSTMLIAQAAAGTAPEAQVLDFGVGGDFNHMNTSVGLGCSHLITQNLNVTLMGSWQTFFTQTDVNTEITKANVVTSYINLFNLLLQLNLRF
ncbi:MAG: hypothetical protein SPJ13_07230 [Bacteroidales bacterium]|nr:hypothetical protein [Bacteroidales bacterium]